MSRAPALDGLRGLSAMSIVVLHAWLYTTTTQEKGDSLLDGVVHQFRLGVPLFFCLSGFLLYRAWVIAARDGTPAPRVADYARRRAWRIVPAYALALVGATALLVPIADVRGVDVPDTHLLALFAVFASNLHPETVGALDPPMWTLAVEVQFYVLLPLLAMAATTAGRRHPAWLLGPPALLIIGGTLFNLHTAGQPGSMVIAASLAALAPCFGCGMVAAVLADRGWTTTRAATVVLLAGGVGLVVGDGVWHEQGAGTAGRIVRDLPAAVGFAAIVLVFAGRRRGWLAARPLQVLGDLSFPIYLWHMPLMLALRGAGLFPEQRPVAALVAVLAVTLPVAWLSWHVVERPLLRWSVSRERARGLTQRAAPLVRPAPQRAAA
jgi:peptidoglycan/LPS O-acetylase OafA/YrhL